MIISTIFTSEYENLFNRTKQIYSGINTFEANLHQENVFADYDLTMTSKGKIFIDNNIIILEYTEPDYYFLKEENNNVIIYSRNENMALSLKNDIGNENAIYRFTTLLNSNFAFSHVNDHLIAYKMIEQNIEINSITIFLNKNTAQIDRIEYLDDLENLVIIELSGQKFSIILSKDIKDFVVPEGANWIENE